MTLKQLHAFAVAACIVGALAVALRPCKPAEDKSSLPLPEVEGRAGVERSPEGPAGQVSLGEPREGLGGEAVPAVEAEGRLEEAAGIDRRLSAAGIPHEERFALSGRLVDGATRTGKMGHELHFGSMAFDESWVAVTGEDGEFSTPSYFRRGTVSIRLTEDESFLLLEPERITLDESEPPPLQIEVWSQDTWSFTVEVIDPLGRGMPNEDVEVQMLGESLRIDRSAVTDSRGRATLHFPRATQPGERIEFGPVLNATPHEAWQRVAYPVADTVHYIHWGQPAQLCVRIVDEDANQRPDFMALLSSLPAGYVQGILTEASNCIALHPGEYRLRGIVPQADAVFHESTVVLEWGEERWIELAPAPVRSVMAVAGVRVHPDGTPAPGNVLARHCGGFGSAETDEHGRFTIELPTRDGDELTVSAMGDYGLGSREIRVPFGATGVRVVDRSAEPTSLFEVILLDATTGKRILGPCAAVLEGEADGDPWISGYILGEDGVIAELIPSLASCWIRIAAEGYRVARHPISFSARSQSDVPVVIALVPGFEVKLPVLKYWSRQPAFGARLIDGDGRVIGTVDARGWLEVTASEWPRCMRWIGHNSVGPWHEDDLTVADLLAATVEGTLWISDGLELHPALGGR